jgi:hypothetical protein
MIKFKKNMMLSKYINANVGIEPWDGLALTLLLSGSAAA